MLITGAAANHPSEFVRGLAEQTKKATAYLCEGESCRPPVESLDALKNLLRIHPL
jgi:uncharacterized protein YyaL (SSP411 family)